MKHKRLAVAVTCVMFAVIVALSAWVICTVRVVSVEYNYCTEATRSEILVEKDRLDKLVGRNVFSVKAEEVAEELAGNPYLFVRSVKVSLPSSVKVVLEERAESYCILSGGSYYPVAESGLVLAKTETNSARADGMPNVLIEGDTPSLAVNSAVPEDKLLSIAVNIILSFGDARNEISSVIIDRYNESSGSTDNEWNRIYVATKEGAFFELHEADVYSEDKLKLLMELYETLEGENRVNAHIEIFTAENGADFEYKWYFD